MRLAAGLHPDPLGELTGVNPAGDAGDTSPPQYFGRGDVNGNIPHIITYFRI